ncbi:hypothetical protein EV702DRAFT_698229 [Suillus placidus]|uniref:Secreted protein n=1 Tax=Suillus placidus TaxID=48579 RepID=A0A9P7CXJ2_9AGAM|nr:hypothetical protein EV702DRAFT_698229 [Suillus placidus]
MITVNATVTLLSLLLGVSWVPKFCRSSESHPYHPTHGSPADAAQVGTRVSLTVSYPRSSSAMSPDGMGTIDHNEASRWSLVRTCRRRNAKSDLLHKIRIFRFACFWES